jgi:serine protease Do
VSDKEKKSIGIIFALIIVAVMFSPRKEAASDKNLFFHRLKLKIENLFDGESPLNLGTQTLVEEESAVISVVENVSPSVVSIVMETIIIDLFSGPLSSEASIGTGFIVDPTGLIVTNSHVVDDPAGEYSVVLSDGETYEVTDVHLDEVSDLAILEINARGLPVVELGDSDSLKVGQKAIAIGNALGRFSNTVTVGVVSGIARQLTARGSLGGSKTYEGAIQTDAALNPGNSGGPLLNSSGQVIGINVATTLGADNIGFAVPVNAFKPLLESFLQEGRIIRPFLGVSYTIITQEISELRDFPEGAFISRVIAGTPAEDSGLERGDIITAIDEAPVTADNSLGKIVTSHKVGDFIDLTVDRDGEVLHFGVTLRELPE